MNVLEKILEEIEIEEQKQREVCKEIIKSPGYRIYEKAVGIVKDIIRSNMNEAENDGWILTSKRLPSEEEFIKAYCRNAYAAEFIVMIKGATLPTTLYFKNGSWTDMKGNYYNVVAWQPLPNPYKGE